MDRDIKKSNKTRKALLSIPQFTPLYLSLIHIHKQTHETPWKTFQYEINPKFPSFHGSFLTYCLSVPKRTQKAENQKETKKMAERKKDEDKNTKRGEEDLFHIHTIYDFSRA